MFDDEKPLSLSFEFPDVSFEFDYQDEESIGRSVLISFLTPYEKQIISCSFNLVTARLNIMKNILPYPKFDWKKANEDLQSYLQKITGKRSEHIFTKYHEYESLPLWKVQVDSHVLQKLIAQVSQEIFTYKGFSALTEFLRDVSYIRKKEGDIISENNKLKKEQIETKKKILPKVASLQKFGGGSIESIETEDAEIIEEKIKGDIEDRYIESSEKARMDQNAMLIFREENDLTEKLKVLNFKLSSNLRCNEETESFLTYETLKLENIIQEWTAKYNKDIEEVDIELIKLGSEKDTIMNKMKNLLIKFQQEEEEVKQLTEFFEEIEREKDLEFRKKKAAFKILEWWRKYYTLKKKFTKTSKKKKRKQKILY